VQVLLLSRQEAAVQAQEQLLPLPRGLWRLLMLELEVR
jgi:hypothetical protein